MDCCSAPVHTATHEVIPSPHLVPQHRLLSVLACKESIGVSLEPIKLQNHNNNSDFFHICEIIVVFISHDRIGKSVQELSGCQLTQRLDGSWSYNLRACNVTILANINQ